MTASNHQVERIREAAWELIEDGHFNLALTILKQCETTSASIDAQFDLATNMQRLELNPSSDDLATNMQRLELDTSSDDEY